MSSYEYARAGLPDFFEPMLAAQYGEETARDIVEACGVRRAVTLRANTLKTTAARVAVSLDTAGIGWEGVPWSPEAFVVKGEREPSVRALPEYEAGEIYLQSLSSMIPPLVLAPEPGADILDMAAAPGGKTTQMAALSGGRARITACEMHGPRAERLKFNLNRQGATNVTVMNTDARRLDDFFSFDQILLDAPCSGSGTLDVRDQKLKLRFTLKLIEKSQKSQRALLAKALRLVKPGGCVVYSTCSVLAQENEDVVRRAVAGQPFAVERVDLPGLDGVPRLPTGLEGALCVRPTELYEGFFVAKIRRLR